MAAIKINFDTAYNPEIPTIILAKKNGDKLGQINVKSVDVSDSLKDASEISFIVYKYIDNQKCALWDEITNFKLVHCVEWNKWFEITVELDEATETKKTVFCTQLGQAELSQIMLYSIEINTENDIARDDYILPTVFYNPNNPESSLLHRLLEKAPHYSVIYVDSHIANIQRTFTFDGTSIYDAFQEIATEIGCLFVFNSDSDSTGKIRRTISVYDLESNCYSCGYRGEFTSICPECGSTEINEGYGEDTNIFVTADELAEDIQLTTEVEAVKNCFKLDAGDDLMTATVRNCNPNGTDYIWYISEDLKRDMSIELAEKIDTYNQLYAYYRNDHIANIDENILDRFNILVEKYKQYNQDLQSVAIPIVGYSGLMNAYYNTIDFSLYLQSGLMPTVTMSDTTALDEVKKLNASTLSPIAVPDLSVISHTTANSAVLAMAKIIVDSRYQVKIESSVLNDTVWSGNFTVTNFSDDEDTAVSETISLQINDDYAVYVQQKIDKALNKGDTTDVSISGLFKMEIDNFKEEIKKYSLNRLTSFYDSCQTCIDVLIEQGVADDFTWSGKDPNLYNDLYVPYLDKLTALETEIKIRQEEIDLILGVYDENGELIHQGLQNYIIEERSHIQTELNFEDYLGYDLWMEFCSFRREDQYSNSNYISDGLDNAELFSKANEFFNTAQKEIYKSAELQHSIACSLKNLLVIKKFEPFVRYFQVGNWIRVLVDDVVYKLRLIKYSISYDDINNISVEFSDVVKDKGSIKRIQDVLAQASSMATSYSSVQKQAQQGENSNNIISGWVNNGFDATNTKIIGGADNQTQTWDNHGMVFRSYDSITDSYDDIQLKIINSTISITDDNWKSVKTAIGAYYYFHPETGKLTRAYGVNAEVMVGNLIIGQHLGIYNDNGNLSFDENGFQITNGVNSFVVNPNSDILLNISNGINDVFYIDNSGVLHINGDGSGIDISTNDDINDIYSKLLINTEAISNESDRAIQAESELINSIVSIREDVTSLQDTSVTYEVLTTNAVVGSKNNSYGSIKIENGQVKWFGDDNSERGTLSVNTTAMNISSANNLNIDSNDTINIGVNGSATNVNIGKDGTNIYLVGNVYINGVLYTP